MYGRMGVTRKLGFGNNLKKKLMTNYSNSINWWWTYEINSYGRYNKNKSEFFYEISLFIFFFIYYYFLFFIKDMGDFLEYPFFPL